MGLSTFSALVGFAIDLEKKGLSILNSYGGGERLKIEEFIQSSQKILQKLETILRENVTEMVMEPCETLNESDYIIRASTKGALETAIEITETQRNFLVDLARIINLKDVGRVVEKLASQKTVLIDKYRGQIKS